MSDATLNDQPSPTDCCAEVTAGDPAHSTCEGAECAQPAPRRRQWIKLVVFIVIMAAAVTVGAYSLLKAPQATATSEPPVVTGAGEPTRPAAAGSPAEEVTAPAVPCCGGSAPVRPKCGGAAPAANAAPKPSCCSNPRPCCGGTGAR